MIRKRLRIAYLVHAYNRRMGHSRYVAELAERFAHDHEVHVYCGEVDDPRPDNIHFHIVPAWKWRSLTYILSFLLPATLAVDSRFDVIHAQGTCGFRQDVTTAHMCQEAWFVEQERCLGTLTWFESFRRLILSTLERITYLDRFSPQVIAISEMNRKALNRHYQRSQNVAVVYHGTDLERFDPRHRLRFRQSIRQELQLNDDAVVGIYVGDLRKGGFATLEALALVPELQLLFVSYSRPDPWQARARALGVHNRVTFCAGTGTVEQYYSAADMLVFPTFHDAFGLVVTEAMASGLPVIVSRAAGASELILDGEEGFLLDNSCDKNELAKALSRLNSDSALRARIGAAARNKVAKFTWDRTAAETLKLYQDLVRRRATRGRKISICQ